MTAAPPLIFEWTGEAFAPANPFHARQCNKHFVAHAHYTLVEHHERSTVTHRHFFAAVREGWKSLPDHLADQFPTADHLRKRLLIDCGFYHETILDVGSVAAALRVAKTMRAMDDFAHIVVRGGIIVMRMAKSQNMRAMDRDEFRASKEKVLDALSELLRVNRDALDAHARAA